jgi:hypothetical protein
VLVASGGMQLQEFAADISQGLGSCRFRTPEECRTRRVLRVFFAALRFLHFLQKILKASCCAFDMSLGGASVHQGPYRSADRGHGTWVLAEGPADLKGSKTLPVTRTAVVLVIGLDRSP